MRRTAIANLKITDINPGRRIITALEKGGIVHTYAISKEWLKAIQDYIANERAVDDEVYQSNRLFLPASSSRNETGDLHPNAINDIWNEVCRLAGVSGKSPH